MRNLVGLYAVIRDDDVLAVSVDEPTAFPGVRVAQIFKVEKFTRSTWVRATTRRGEELRARVPATLL